MIRGCPYHQDSGTWTKLQSAAHYNHLQVMTQEIEQGGDINFVDRKGNNALHLVCCELHFSEECVLYLLNLKPNINAQNNRLQTALHLFINNSHLDVDLLRLFLEGGADPNKTDDCGNTSLHYLAGSRAHKSPYFAPFAEMLIEHKANVNARNKWDETPLHHAIRRGTAGLIPILLNHGASVSIRNNQYLTPIEAAYARRYDDEEVFLEMGKYVIMLNNCNVTMRQDILDEIYSHESMLTFKEECKKELLKMKDIRVGHTNLTLYTILKSSTYAFAKYLRNPEVMNIFQNNTSGISTYFKSRLDQHFKDSLTRKALEERASPILMSIFEILPENCVDSIIMHVGTDDLKIIK